MLLSAVGWSSLLGQDSEKNFRLGQLICRLENVIPEIEVHAAASGLHSCYSGDGEL